MSDLSPKDVPKPGSQRMVKRWLCYECGCTCHHSVTHYRDLPKIIVDGWQAQYVKLPSTRQRHCSDCGEVKRHGYREVKSPNDKALPQPPDGQAGAQTK